MARPKNTVTTDSMTIAVTPQLKRYLEVLAVAGVYGGGSVQDVAKYLLNNSIQELIVKGLLTPGQWKPGAEPGEVEIVVEPTTPTTIHSRL